MPSPPTEPDALAAAVTTCTCGYDLTGLPADAAAKCPECGAVIADLVPPVPVYDRWWAKALAVVSPGLVFVGLLPLELLSPARWFVEAMALVIALVALVLLVRVSVRAGFALVSPCSRFVPGWVEVAVMLAVIPVVVYANLLLAMGCLMLTEMMD